MRNRLRDESGSILPLTIFYGFLSLVLVLLVVAATSLYLERKRLYSLADGAAVVGAEAYDLDQVSRAPDGSIKLQLRSADVAAAVDDYLRDVPPTGFDSLRVERAASLDGRSASVALSARWRPPVVTVFVPSGIRIDVTSVARSVLE